MELLIDSLTELGADDTISVIPDIFNRESSVFALLSLFVRIKTLDSRVRGNDRCGLLRIAEQPS